MQESSPPPNPLLSQNLHQTQTANKPPTRRIIGGLCASRRFMCVRWVVWREGEASILRSKTL